MHSGRESHGIPAFEKRLTFSQLTRHSDWRTGIEVTIMRQRILVLWALVGVAVGYPARADVIDEYVTAQLDAQHIPGLSLAVMRDGAVIKTGGYGYSNLETQSRASASTVYPLCSVTKQFVAAGILLLERDGKLTLDDPIEKHLDFTAGNWRGTTLRHLLTMTSGIKDYINDPLTPGVPSLAESRDFPKSDTSADEILRRVAALPPNFPPGERFAYSNSNYIILAHVITRISGKPWHAFLDDRIFQPLGMTHTGYDDALAIVPNRAGRYEVIGDLGSQEFRNSDWVNPTFWWQGGAGIVSSVNDMAKWDAALRRGRVLSQTDLRKIRLQQALSEGNKNSYGYGWNNDPYEGHGRMWHNGSVPGSSIHFARFDDGKLSVVVMANTPANLDAIAIDIAGMLEPALAHPILLVDSTSASAIAGSPVEFNVRTTNWGTPIDGLIAIEIRSAPYGRADVAAKLSSDKRRFLFRKPIRNSFTWRPPHSGVYRIYIGIFSEDWSRLYAWRNSAGVILAK
jgi:CubicO group peptidase (beta-lactamase class C family)